MATNKAQNYSPETGAHALVDLRLNSLDYLAGEEIDATTIPDADLRQMWAANRVGFGKPSQNLVARLKLRSKELAEVHRTNKQRLADAAQAQKEADDLELAEMERYARANGQLGESGEAGAPQA
jgi:hypothetical protein